MSTLFSVSHSPLTTSEGQDSSKASSSTPQPPIRVEIEMKTVSPSSATRLESDTPHHSLPARQESFLGLPSSNTQQKAAHPLASTQQPEEPAVEEEQEVRPQSRLGYLNQQEDGDKGRKWSDAEEPVLHEDELVSEDLSSSESRPTSRMYMPRKKSRGKRVRLNEFPDVEGEGNVDGLVGRGLDEDTPDIPDKNGGESLHSSPGQDTMGSSEVFHPDALTEAEEEEAQPGAECDKDVVSRTSVERPKSRCQSAKVGARTGSRASQLAGSRPGSQASHASQGKTIAEERPSSHTSLGQSHSKSSLVACQASKGSLKEATKPTTPPPTPLDIVAVDEDLTREESMFREDSGLDSGQVSTVPPPSASALHHPVIKEGHDRTDSGLESALDGRTSTAAPPAGLEDIGEVSDQGKEPDVESKSRPESGASYKSGRSDRPKSATVHKSRSSGGSKKSSRSVRSRPDPELPSQVQKMGSDVKEVVQPKMATPGGLSEGTSDDAKGDRSQGLSPEGVINVPGREAMIEDECGSCSEQGDVDSAQFDQVVEAVRVVVAEAMADIEEDERKKVEDEAVNEGEGTSTNVVERLKEETVKDIMEEAVKKDDIGAGEEGQEEDTGEDAVRKQADDDSGVDKEFVTEGSNADDGNNLAVQNDKPSDADDNDKKDTKEESTKTANEQGDEAPKQESSTVSLKEDKANTIKEEG